MMFTSFLNRDVIDKIVSFEVGMNFFVKLQEAYSGLQLIEASLSVKLVALKKFGG